MNKFNKNKHGIPVKKGCFSCAYRFIDEKEDWELRTCMLEGSIHLRCYLCENWKMRAGLQKAGMLT